MTDGCHSAHRNSADRIRVEVAAPTRLAAAFIAKFTVLKGAQRELWLTFLIKFLIYTAYSVTNKTMVLWLSKDLGFSDQAAGALVGWVWAPAMTVFTLLAGSLTDAIGLAPNFLSWRRDLHGRARGDGRDNDPMAGARLRRSSARGRRGAGHAGAARRDAVLFDDAQRSISFSIIYVIMNVGYLVAGMDF